MRRRVDLKATRLVADMLREAASNVEATFFEVALPLITEARQAVRAMGRGEKLPVNDDLAPLRARVARLEGALGGLYVRCRAEGWLRRRDVVTEMDTARAVLQDAMQGVVTIATLAPDAARKEGV